MKKGIFVIIGGAIQGLGMGLFLFPNSIPSGGAGGLAILINYFFNVNIGLALWGINFIMLLFGISYLGKRFALWTVIGITMTSLSVNFFETHFEIMHRNLLYDLVIGSLFLGTGIGLQMRKRVSNGGVGVIAYMIAFKRNIRPGKPLFYINCFIFFLTAAIISWKIFLLALFSQWVSTRMVDLICSINLYKTTYILDWRKK